MTALFTLAWAVAKQVREALRCAGRTERNRGGAALLDRYDRWDPA